MSPHTLTRITYTQQTKGMPWHTFNINICRALKMATNATKVQQSAPCSLLSHSPPSPVCWKLHTNFVSILAWPKNSFFLLSFCCVGHWLCLWLYKQFAGHFVCVFVLLCECMCVLWTLATLNKLPQHLLAFHAKTLSLKFLWNLSWCVCFLVFPICHASFLHSFLHRVSRAFSNQMKI